MYWKCIRKGYTYSNTYAPFLGPLLLALGSNIASLAIWCGVNAAWNEEIARTKRRSKIKSRLLKTSAVHIVCLIYHNRPNKVFHFCSIFQKYVKSLSWTFQTKKKKTTQIVTQLNWWCRLLYYDASLRFFRCSLGFENWIHIGK